LARKSGFQARKWDKTLPAADKAPRFEEEVLRGSRPSCDARGSCYCPPLGSVETRGGHVSRNLSRAPVITASTPDLPQTPYSRNLSNNPGVLDGATACPTNERLLEGGAGTVGVVGLKWYSALSRSRPDMSGIPATPGRVQLSGATSQQRNGGVPWALTAKPRGVRQRRSRRRRALPQDEAL